MRTRNLWRLIAVALVAALSLPSVTGAQDRTRTTGVYVDDGGNRLNVTSGGIVTGPFAQVIRSRFSIAQVNAGATILAAVPGFKYRVHDVALIAIGGAVGTCTTVDILGTQTTPVKLLAAAVAALTENTLLRAGASNATILAAGASFVQNDVNTALAIGKTGGTCDTATSVDVLLTYELKS